MSIGSWLIGNKEEREKQGEKEQVDLTFTNSLIFDQ